MPACLPAKYDAGRQFPVLTAEPTPFLDTATWTMTVDGLVEAAHTWTWSDLHQMVQSEFRGDNPLRHHLVEAFEVRFSGIKRRPAARIGRARWPGPPTCWPPRRPVTRQPAVGARRQWASLDSSGPTTAIPSRVEHGGPVRLLVPHLYFWKSAKWITRLTLLDHEPAGFLEQNGLPRPR